MRILVVGAGAVGGYFGLRLAQAGRDVTFLVRPARAEQLRRDGLRVVSPHGDATIAPKLVAAGALREVFDVIFLSVKGFGLDAAVRDFGPAVGPDTVILPVLNGMRHLGKLTDQFGPQPVLGGVCLVAIQMVRDRIVQLAEIQQLRYGALDGRVTDRLRALDATMQDAGFDAALSETIVQDMWDKWVQLASLGAVTCLLRGPIGEIVAVPGGADVSRSILQECVAIAAASGHPPSKAFLERNEATLTAQGSKLTSSMFRDLRDGNQVEVDEIIGDLLALGRTHRIRTPFLDAALTSLQVYQNARAIR